MRPWRPNPNLPNEDEHHWCSGDETFASFLYRFRKHIKLTPEKAIFVFTSNKTLVPSSWLMSAVYLTHRNSNGTLELTYSQENCFGCSAVLFW